MVVVEQMIQKVFPGKWDALDEIDKRYDVVESRHGFPAKKRLMSISSVYDLNTILIVREWKSMAAMEHAYESAFADPEHQALAAEIGNIVESSRIELYSPR